MEPTADRIEALERQLAELSRQATPAARRPYWRMVTLTVAALGLTTVLLRPGTAQGNGNGLTARVAALETQVTALQQELAAERAARMAAVAALQTATDAETAARQVADTALQNALSAEANTRQAADTALQNGLAGEAAARNTADTALQNQISPLAFILEPFSRTGSEIYISGANVNITNGLGSTETVNGLGNLIVGYNEVGALNQRGGSHNLVIGRGHRYTSYGGMVVGLNNSILNDYAVVSGGQGNSATGRKSAVSGGALNHAQGINASVSGGFGNTASGVESSVSGGLSNVAAGHASSVSGGRMRTAQFQYDWVAGGLAQPE